MTKTLAPWPAFALQRQDVFLMYGNVISQLHSGVGWDYIRVTKRLHSGSCTVTSLRRRLATTAGLEQSLARLFESERGACRKSSECVFAPCPAKLKVCRQFPCNSILP